MASCTNINWGQIKNIHLIGIGGSGIFPIAKVLQDKGFNVSGSDTCKSETTEKAKNSGINVCIGHKAENVNTADLVVFSSAIKDINPEIVEANHKGIPCIERSVMLGIILSKYKNSIAVSGTHGKTSTTSMITNILLDAQRSPTSIIGGTLPRIKGNSCIGDSDIIVCEACEYVDSFLKLFPKISIILNVDSDHLDYFKTLDGVKKSFKKFANQTKDFLIVNNDDPNAVEIIKGANAQAISYGLSKGSDYFADNITLSYMQAAEFDLFHDSNKITHMKLAVPGKHNVYNAIASAISCLLLGIPIEIITESLNNFHGAHRRFEILDNINNITIADDFAHHPTEIEATLTTAKNMNFNRIIVVFQPHTFSRTFKFLNKFAEVLSIADKVVITDILPVRETNSYNIHSIDLASKISECTYLATFEEAASSVTNELKPGDLVLTMGGGNIYECAHIIIDKLNKKFN